MHTSIRLLIYYLQTQGEATNESKTEVNKLITTRDDYILRPLSQSVHTVTVIRNQSANQSDV